MIMGVFVYLMLFAYFTYRRDFLNSSFFVLALTSLFHIPFAVFYYYEIDLIGGVLTESIAYMSRETILIIPGAIAAVVLGAMVAQPLGVITSRPIPRVISLNLYFVPFATVLASIVFALAIGRFVYVGSTGYHMSGGYFLIHPVVDWFLKAAYLVCVALLFERDNWRPTRQNLLFLLPFLVFLVSGSRQFGLGPIVACVLIFSFMHLTARLRYTLLVVVTLTASGVLALVRDNRITAEENVIWNGVDGPLGVIVETGRTARLVEWAKTSCPEPIGAMDYLIEAGRRLIPLSEHQIENLSTTVWGGGNAFSVIAEGYCVAGDSYLLWVGLMGAFWGGALGFSRSSLRAAKGRIKLFLFIAIAITWPRDELLGYARELVWISIVLPILFSVMFSSSHVRRADGRRLV